MDKRFALKRNIQVLYICIAILFSAIITVVILHKLLEERRKDSQQNVESRLPTGDYLPDAENPLIRVVIKTDGFKQIAHSEVKLSSEYGLDVAVNSNHNTRDKVKSTLDSQESEIMQEISSGEILTLTPDHELFKYGSIRITPKSKHDDHQTVL